LAPWRTSHLGQGQSRATLSNAQNLCLKTARFLPLIPDEQRLTTVPGIGPIISSAIVAAIGTGSGFKQGRDFAAWLGLVPKQESTGDRTLLGRISKRGNKYLRTLFVRAAHVSSSSGAPRQRCAPSGPGSSRPPSASPIAICWQSPSLTSSRASLGLCLHAAAITSQGSRPMPHNIRLLRFTKGMGALPLRHPRSPILLHCASERGWLRGNGFT
jgi:hypothetical protein